MKNVIILFSMLLSTFTVLAQETKESYSITVTIENIKNNNGNVLLSLHTKDTFMKGAGIQNLSSEIKDGKIEVTFKNVAKGTYAIMALHDENNNNRMDFEVSGMPKESYGMSNNEMSFGPPQFVDAKFEVTDQSLNLNIRF